jgi:predicted cation transporter
MFAGLEAASVIPSIATVIGWGLSFVGVNKYMKSRGAHYDNGFPMILTVLVSVAVGILAAAVTGKLFAAPTPPIETGTIVTAMAVVIVWGASFLGIHRYIKSHAAQYDNGFYMMLTVAASLAVAIAAAAAASMLSAAPTPAIDVGMVITVMIVAIYWGASFLGIHRYVKSHAAQYDNGFYMMLTVAASLVVAIAAAAATSRIAALELPSASLGYGVTFVDLGLGIIALAVLIGPFTVKKIEHNLEAFLFLMGVLSVTVAGVWEMRLVEEAVMEPVVKGIVPAVLVAGMLFHYGRSSAQSAMNSILKTVPLRAVVFVMIVALGMASSIITAIIASLLLVEMVNCLPLDRKNKINLVIIACFSIGLGAVLTPLGEPLSTIAVSKLQGPPYNAGFFFLFDKLAGYVIPGVLAMGLLGMFMVRKTMATQTVTTIAETERLWDVVVRAAKVYIFVMALLLLGGGMKIIIDKYFTAIPSEVLFWVNMLSAVLDNATLTAAEIAPSLSMAQISAALMGLLIAGGMLIPGNIPNIISASKLGITSKEWARLGVPLGLGIMLVYFVWIFFTPFQPSFSI